MKRETKNYILLGSFVLAGLVIGGVLVYEAIKAKKRADENKEIEKELNENLEGVFEDEYSSDRDSENVMYTPKEIAENERREALLKNWNKPPIGEGATLEEEMAESEHPMDSDEDEGAMIFDNEDEMKALEEDFDFETFKNKNRKKPPEAISAETAYEYEKKGLDIEEWIYWSKDDIFTDESEVPIDDFMRFVGDSLDEEEFRDNDAEEIYILSYEFMMIYHVTKYIRSFADNLTGGEKLIDSLEYA